MNVELLEWFADVLDGLRLKLVIAGKEIPVHIEVEFEEDGEIYVKVIRDDGKYAIVRSKIDPRITEYYTEDELKTFKPRLVFVDEQNKVVEKRLS